MKTNLRRSGIAIAALVIAGLGAGPAEAAGAVTTSLFLPLMPGSVSILGGACAGDVVTLSGMVHVVSIFNPNPPPISQAPAPPPISQSPGPPPIKLHLNMAGVMGTGGTGNTYVATGAQKFEGPDAPPITPQGFTIVLGPEGPPIRLSPDGPPIFTLEGTGACTSQLQLPVSFKLVFDQTGHLLPTSTAGFGQCSLDLACQ
jgi:hypothetical protein